MFILMHDACKNIFCLNTYFLDLKKETNIILMMIPQFSLFWLQSVLLTNAFERSL